jgi:mutator protein MutT
MDPIMKKLIGYIEMTIGQEDKVEKTMIAAAGIIMKEGENGEKMVLLIQRSKDDHWPLHFEFPRGKCDKPVGESPDKCALREIKEETGLDVKIEKFIEKFEYLAEGGKRRTICYNFLCSMKNPDQKVKLSKEHQGHKWITQLGEADLMVLPDQKRILGDVLSKENPIVSNPENSFTKTNTVDEFLNRLNKKE